MPTPPYKLPGPYPPQPYPVRKPGRFARVPVAIQLIAWLILFGGACMLLASPLPIPIFIAGGIFRGLAAHLSYALLGSAACLVGWGLLRLDPRARLLAFAYLACGIVNSAVCITPRATANLQLFNQQVTTSILSAMTLPNQPVPAIPSMPITPATMVPSLVFGIGLNLTIAYFLWKYRGLFPSATKPGI